MNDHEHHTSKVSSQHRQASDLEPEDLLRLGVVCRNTFQRSDNNFSRHIIL